MSKKKGQDFIKPYAYLPLEWRWTRGSGPAKQFFYEGSFSRCETQAYALMDEYDSIIIRPKNNGVGEWYRLEAAQNGEDVTEDYEVDGSSLTQNTLTNLNIKARYLDLGYPEESFASVFSKIAAEVKKVQQNQQTYDAMLAAVATIFDDPLGVEFADDLYRYGDQFLNAQYCFRHTITVADRVFFANAGSFEGIFDKTNRIFTEAQLRDEENIPEDFTLPPQIRDNTQPAEWLKMPSRTRYGLGHARTIVIEYLFADSWSRLKYGTA